MSEVSALSHSQRDAELGGPPVQTQKLIIYEDLPLKPTTLRNIVTDLVELLRL